MSTMIDTGRLTRFDRNKKLVRTRPDGKTEEAYLFEVHHYSHMSVLFMKDFQQEVRGEPENLRAWTFNPGEHVEIHGIPTKK